MSYEDVRHGIWKLKIHIFHQKFLESIRTHPEELWAIENSHKTCFSGSLCSDVWDSWLYWVDAGGHERSESVKYEYWAAWNRIEHPSSISGRFGTPSRNIEICQKSKIRIVDIFGMRWGVEIVGNTRTMVRLEAETSYLSKAKSSTSSELIPKNSS